MEYKDPQYAEIVYKSLEVDNEGFVEGVLDDDTINFKIEIISRYMVKEFIKIIKK